MRMPANNGGASLPVYVPPQPSRKEIYDDELKSVLTKAEVAQLWHKSPDTVKLDIQMGRLYAEKKGENPNNSRSGIWLIPFSAASDLYGDINERVYHGIR